MAFVTPYTTEKFTSYLDITTSTKVSIVVWLVDEYTKQGPAGDIKVTLKEGDIKPIKNPSGYYIFINLPDGKYHVSIESEFYFYIKEIEVDVSSGFKEPVEIILKPKPSYPFPSHATLVRGRVKDTNSVVDVIVAVEGKPEKAKTDERGEFVLYFKGVEEESIKVKIKAKTFDAAIKRGKTVSMGVLSLS